MAAVAGPSTVTLNHSNTSSSSSSSSSSSTAIASTSMSIGARVGSSSSSSSSSSPSSSSLSLSSSASSRLNPKSQAFSLQQTAHPRGWTPSPSPLASRLPLSSDGVALNGHGHGHGHGPSHSQPQPAHASLGTTQHSLAPSPTPPPTPPPPPPPPPQQQLPATAATSNAVASSSTSYHHPHPSTSMNYAAPPHGDRYPPRAGSGGSGAATAAADGGAAGSWFRHGKAPSANHHQPQSAAAHHHTHHYNQHHHPQHHPHHHPQHPHHQHHQHHQQHQQQHRQPLQQPAWLAPPPPSNYHYTHHQHHQQQQQQQHHHPLPLPPPHLQYPPSPPLPHYYGAPPPPPSSGTPPHLVQQSLPPYPNNASIAPAAPASAPPSTPTPATANVPASPAVAAVTSPALVPIPPVSPPPPPPQQQQQHVPAPQLVPAWEQPSPSSSQSPPALAASKSDSVLASPPAASLTRAVQHQFNNMSPILEPPRSTFLVRPESSISQRLAASATGGHGASSSSSSSAVSRRQASRPSPDEAPGFAIAANVHMPKEWKVQYEIWTTRSTKVEQPKAPPVVETEPALPPPTTPRPVFNRVSDLSTPSLSTPVRDYLLSTVSTTATAASSVHSSPVLTTLSPTTTITTLEDAPKTSPGVTSTVPSSSPTSQNGDRTAAADESSTPKSPTDPTSAPTLAPPASPAPPAWGVKKSWADLLRSPGSSVSSPTRQDGSAARPPIIEYIPKASPNGTAGKKTLAQTLAGVENEFQQPHPIVPRGLINNGNLCFANAILQVLVYCAPFVNLLDLIKKEVMGDLSGRTPSMDAMIHFLSEFRSSAKTTVVSRNRLSKPIPSSPATLGTKVNDLKAHPKTPITPSSQPHDTFIPLSEYAEPFVPEGVYESLKPNKRFDAMRRGHQEDAEEFLGFFLDTLHEEILSTIDRVDGANKKEKFDEVKAVEDEQDEEWVEVGSKGRIATTRTTETRESPVTRIYGGQLRSILRCPGQKDSITLEPYQRLQLDIEPDHVRTIEDALLNLTLPEPLPGFISAKGLRVEAMKQVYLESFPPVLILHLKRFLFDNVGGVQKSGKLIGYGTELEIGEKIVGPTKRPGKPVKYELFGVVYHHGNYASGGHYTVAVRQQIHSNGSWLHIDDTSIRPISTADVAVKVTGKGTGKGREGVGAGSGAGSGMGSHASSMMMDGEKRAYLLMYNRVD